uniref:Uncharacterized protein n=1 Tax=Bombyx mori TaxID=7091 RepID=A0A8R2M761_BOMMO|nr:uncharacterized protein LOC101737620 isoform X4 [Bombyx mori]
MMVKISGLPPNIKCYDVKTLIKRECNIIDIILDDLVGDVNACKTIRVGLADDEEGCRVIKCLNGFRFGDKYIIKVEQVCKSSSSNTKQTDSGPADRYQPTNYHNYPGTNSSNDHKIGYPSNKSGNQSLTSQGPGNYDKGPYGSQGHWKESSQYITKTDDFRASTNFNVDQAGYQAGHNQNQWGNKNTSRPQNFDSFTAPNLTNTRDCRSPDQSRSVTMSTPLLTKILHNLTNPPQRLIQNDGSSSPPRRNSSFGRQESRNIGRPQSPRENPPQTRHRQPERPVSPGKRAMQQGWQSDFKQTPQRTKDVPSNRNISPPGQRTPAGRPKSPSWTAPIRYSPPRASARQQFPSSARVFDFRRPGEKSMSGPHVMQPPGPTQPGYTNVDNKNVRFPPFVRTNNPYEQYMENNPASSQARPQHIQSQETIQPMYSGGYPSSHKGNASQPAWGPVQKTSWQQETKRVFDPKLGDNVNLPPPVHMRSPRSPVRRGSSIGQPVWGETHNVQADNARNPGWRPDPFQETVAKRQSGAGNVQRFENSLGGRSDFYEGIQHPPPGSFRSNVDPQTNDYREPNSSTRSSKESFQFQRMQRPSSEMQEGPRWSKGRDEHRNDFGDAYKKNRDLSSVPGLRSIDHQNSRDHEANRPNSQTQLCARPPAEPEWDIDRMNDPMMNPKRDKAVEAIVSTILKKHQYLAECGDEERIRVIEELKNELGQLFIDMFGDRDISYIEIMIKYKAKFGDKDEEVMIENVLSKLSIEMRCLKRSAPDYRRSSRSVNRERRSSSYTRRDRFDRPGPSQDYRLYRSNRRESEKKLKENQRNDVRDNIRRVAVINRNKNAVNQNRTTFEELYRKPYVQVRKAVEDQPRATPNDVSELPTQMSKTVDGEPDDPMRNVLGPNLKKTFTGVYNPLNMKLSFDRLPRKAGVSLFLKTHNCCGLKKMNSKGIDYCTRARDANTLNRICAQKHFTIDNSNVTVTPMYRHMKRPPYPKTVFDGKQRRTMIGRTENRKVINTAVPFKDKIDDRPKVTAKTRKTETLTRDTKSAEAKHDITALSNSTVSKLDVSKSKSNTTVIKVGNKVINIKESTDRREKQGVDDPKPIVSINEVAKTKSNTTKNEVGNKAVKINVPTNRTEKTLPQSKQTTKRSNIDEDNLFAKRPITMTTTSLEDGNDNDELNDSEIQELLLRSIILDECGGPDKKIPDKQSLEVERENELRMKKINVDTEAKPYLSTGKSLAEENDYDELNDNEIKAMLSEIIVIDECGLADMKPKETSKKTNEEQIGVKVKTDSKLGTEKSDFPTLPNKSDGAINEKSDDELSDSEIRAMLAESVVLDECGESDSE